MNNYEFCQRYVLDHLPHASAKVLDYGCGQGEIVALLRERQVDAYGCDLFYQGGNRIDQVKPPLLEKGYVRPLMEDGKIPFSDQEFDIVVNNQVLEHVEDLDAVLQEIHRILKPGGLLLSLFPDRSVWWEGHCGIPFLHRIPRGRFRIAYAKLLRRCGLGFHKKNKSPQQWSEDFCSWLDQWTHYRSIAVIRSSFEKYFSPLIHEEDLWLKTRLGKDYFMMELFPVFLRRFFVRKTAGLIFSCRKKSQF